MSIARPKRLLSSCALLCFALACFAVYAPAAQGGEVKLGYGVSVTIPDAFSVTSKIGSEVPKADIDKTIATQHQVALLGAAGKAAPGTIPPMLTIMLVKMSAAGPLGKVLGDDVSDADFEKATKIAIDQAVAAAKRTNPNGEPPTIKMTREKVNGKMAIRQHVTGGPVASTGMGIQMCYIPVTDQLLLLVTGFYKVGDSTAEEQVKESIDSIKVE
jgi:hypothetical protein